MATRIILILAALVLMGLVMPVTAQTPAPTQPAPPTTPAPAPAQPPTTSTPALTADQIQSETNGARALIEKVIHSNKNDLPSPDLLSNRSATLVGVMALAVLSATTDMASSVATGPQKARLQKIGHLVRVVELKYNLNLDKEPGDAVISGLEKKGRAFFGDVSATLLQVSKIEPSKSRTSSPGGISTEFPTNIDDYSFTPVSPTNVKIVAKTKPDQPLSAILEDGQWRLDFGGFEDMEKSGGSKPAGAD